MLLVSGKGRHKQKFRLILTFRRDSYLSPEDQSPRNFSEFNMQNNGQLTNVCISLFHTFLPIIGIIMAGLATGSIIYKK